MASLPDKKIEFSTPAIPGTASGQIVAVTQLHVLKVRRRLVGKTEMLVDLDGERVWVGPGDTININLKIEVTA